MTDSTDLDEKIGRNQTQRIEQIERWAEYVRSHPDEEWGRQVNTLVDAQLQSARHARQETERADDT
ncbi:hypothetical protein [Halococcoides cellulosivorans]|uniref:Uncharacterized protein n=1 Tax=Halococcoides cellulosivorans TaxID=1679096 RepID=A0A2R4WYU8_9EURY|nr:hypothetical protein [Halococcoides cellulosivorans]AWB26719.1 hypothetical protein HARCEL1_02810 [Halococcoides cellulosivorans]